MNIVVMQPSYLPYMGYFDLIVNADVFLYYDVVQFDKDSWRNRNRIKTPQGPQWLTVPVLTKGQSKPTHAEIRINRKENWRRKHLKSIEINYRKARFFDEIFPTVENILNRDWDRLLDLNAEIIKEFCQLLNIGTKIDYVSKLNLSMPEGKNEKLIAIAKAIGADQFYEPKGGAGYIDRDLFEKEGIGLTMQDYHHPVYSQLFGDFAENLSTLDLLMNCGRDSSEYFKRTLNPLKNNI